MANSDILSDISQDPDITLHILDNYIGSAYSPQVDVTETATGHDVAITYDDADEGIKTKTFSVEDGQDYVLTQEDRTTIAGIVEDDLDTYIDAMSRATATANQQEQARATAESGRVTAEQARQTAETARNSAEGTRAQAESQRAESERQRGAAEQSRATAETARQSAENARATAEQARALAETQRAEQWATLKADAVSATNGANSAAASASEAESELRTAAARGDFDGYSPTVSIESTTSEHTVTVTDRNGPHAYTVPTYADEEAARAQEWAALKADAQAATDAAQAAATEVAPKVSQLWGNQLTRELSGEVLTASDAYAAPPMALTVEGKSTQDGTPTPDAPVEIVSVENTELTFAGKNLLDVTAWELGINSGITLVEGGTALRIQQQSYQEQRNRYYLPFAANYTFSFDYETIALSNENARVYLLIRKADGTSAGVSAPIACVAIGHKAHITMTVPIDTAYITFGNWAQSGTIIVRNIQLELGTTATAYAPYDGTNVLLNLTQALRSLPDGTHDALSFAYLRPSTREGWAWYTPSFTKRVEQYLFSDFSWVRGSRNYDDTGYVYRSTTHRSSTARADGALSTVAAFVAHAATSWAWEGLPVNAIGMYVGDGSGGYPLFCADYANASDLVAAIGDETLLLPLAAPVTTQLDPIELPVLPAPTCTVRADPSTGLQMEYVRDTNLAYAQLEAALADLATS